MHSTSAARCAARALARNAHCRRRIAVGAVGQGPCRGRSRPPEWAVRPTAASARFKRIERKGESVVREARCRLREVQCHASGQASRLLAGPAHTRSAKSRGQFGRRPCGPRRQRWYASPSKCKHNYKSKSEFKPKAKSVLAGRGLTLRSSGQPPGYRRLPLNSNVRPRRTACSDSIPSLEP